jgi:hypothetical protein
MPQPISTFHPSRKSKIILSLSMVVALFWFFGHTLDVYRFKLVGAIFEILWLPMIILLFVLPILSVIFFIKEKYNLRSLYIYSFLALALAVLLTLVW